MKTHNFYLHILVSGFLVLGLIACNKSTEQKAKINLEEITIAELQEGYKSGKFSVVEITQAYLDRIKEIDDSGPMLNSVIRSILMPWKLQPVWTKN